MILALMMIMIMYSTYNEDKLVFADRFIEKLKDKIYEI